MVVCEFPYVQNKLKTFRFTTVKIRSFLPQLRYVHFTTVKIRSFLTRDL